MERHEDIRELLADYALGELSPEARARVDAHLAVCAECALEARGFSTAYESVGLSATSMTPPASIKGRVLASLESTRVGEPGPVAPPIGVAPVRPDRRWLAIAAAAVLVLGGMLAVSQQRAARLADELRRVDAEAERLVAEAATVAGQADLAVAILTAPDMRRIDLQGFDLSRDATARAYWSGTKGLLIVADRLPVPPPGRTYQVWLIRDGTPAPVSAGLIDGHAGRGMLIVAPPGGATGRSVTVAVTDEPDGGLPAPSGSKHLVGSM